MSFKNPCVPTVDIPLSRINDSSMAKLRQARYFMAVGSMVFVFFCSQPGFGNILDSKKYSRIIWNYLETLCAFGPRNPGSEGYRETLNLIRKVGENRIGGAKCVEFYAFRANSIIL